MNTSRPPLCIRSFPKGAITLVSIGVALLIHLGVLLFANSQVDPPWKSSGMEAWDGLVIEDDDIGLGVDQESGVIFDPIWAFEAHSQVSLPAPGFLHFNSSGRKKWRWVEGDDYTGFVEVADPPAPKPVPKPPRQLTAQDKAFAWLLAHQNADGSWGERQQVELTSLVMMAAWKEGWDADLPGDGEAFQKAGQWLVKNGKGHAGRFTMGAAEWAPGEVRAHALATRVLADYFAYSKDESFREAIKAAAAYIVGGQAPDGGWADQFQKTTGDLDVSIWQVLALKSVHLSGLKLPGIDAALDGAIKFIDTKRASDGSYAQSTNDTAAVRDRETAVALLVEMMWKDDREGQRESVKYLMENRGGEGKWDYQGAATSLEGVYFRMNAMLYFGGSAWITWNRTFADLIRDAQSEDGSWPPMAAPGDRNLQGAKDLSGAVYRTAMMSLCIPPFRIRWIPSEH